MFCLYTFLVLWAKGPTSWAVRVLILKVVDISCYFRLHSILLIFNNIPGTNPLRAVYLMPKIALRFRPIGSLSDCVVLVSVFLFSQ